MKLLSKVVLFLFIIVVGVLVYFWGNDLFCKYKNSSINAFRGDLSETTLNYIPTQVLGDELIKHNYYTLSYISDYQNAEWTAYELIGAWLDLPNGEKRQGFKSDPASEVEANSSDYNYSGYDRGHLVPAHDMNFNREAMMESFYMTNISPQVPHFNRGVWKRLEGRVRKWAIAEKRLFIITGTLFGDNAKKSRVSKKGPYIPQGFYKIILDYDCPRTKGIAFMFRNEATDEPLESFVTTIDVIEAKTGLDFFPNLTKEEEIKLEGHSNSKLWAFK
jgi:endonuclease G